MPPAITVMAELGPLAQSAELQIRRSLEAMTTDRNFGLMLNRQGWLLWETTCAVKVGVLPG